MNEYDCTVPGRVCGERDVALETARCQMEHVSKLRFDRRRCCRGSVEVGHHHVSSPPCGSLQLNSNFPSYSRLLHPCQRSHKIHHNKDRVSSGSSPPHGSVNEPSALHVGALRHQDIPFCGTMYCHYLSTERHMTVSCVVYRTRRSTLPFRDGD